ncbi:MAG: hypothetical protein KA354_16965 [Phycisphaerae bacterium]|nr:hypothetical protein [Phycisphaerae bacterium]
MSDSDATGVGSIAQPSTRAVHGTDRDAGGKFLPGNRVAKGNPFAKKVAALRSVLLRTVKASDLKEMVRKLVSAAKDGDTVAAREVLNRLLGPAIQVDILQRLEDVEARLSGGVERAN